MVNRSFQSLRVGFIVTDVFAIVAAWLGA